MGAMGGLPEGKKYVLKIEIPGPKTAAQAEKISKIVADLKQTFGASEDTSVGSKSKTKSKTKRK